MWFGSVESKLRHLTMTLRRCPKVASAHIWPVAFSKPRKSGGFLSQTWYIGIKLQECQDGYQPHPSQPALVFSHHQFKSPPPPVPARKPGYICGSGGHDLRMEKQLKVAFHTVS